MVNVMQRREYPIKDYALLGNCETVGSSPRRRDRLALPRRVRGTVIFGALLDPEKGGEFGTRSDGDYRVDRRYVPTRRPRDALL